MTLQLRSGVSAAEVDYGIALLDERSGQYWHLNATGSLALEVLLDGGTDEQAAQALAEQYAVDPETARQDVRGLVDDLCSAGLVDAPAGRRRATGRKGARR